MSSLTDLTQEMRLVYAERRDRLNAAQTAIVRGDRRAPFSIEEITKRRSRLPQLVAIGRGLVALQARRHEVPEWILEAFEGGSDGV